MRRSEIRARLSAKRRSSKRSGNLFGALEACEPRALLSAVGLDPTFGAGGMATLDFSGAYDEGYAVAELAGGKILVAGRSSSPEGDCDFALARYNADGTLDSSFGAGGTGYVLTDFFSAGDAAFSMVVQSDGKIVLAGQTDGGSTSYDFALARYNADGSLDQSFGAGGKVTTDFAGSFDVAYALAQDSSGKLVVAGLASDANFNFAFALARYNSDGSLDSSFGAGGDDGDGKVSTPIGLYGGSAYAIAFQGSKMVVGGYAYGMMGSDLGMVRYNADGSLDESFGDDGVAVTDLGYEDETVRALAVTGNGIYMAGMANSDIAVAHFTANGALDTAFGNGGSVLVDFSDDPTFFNDRDSANAMLVMADGSLLVGGYAHGYTSGDVALIKLHSDGSADLGFDDDGAALIDLGSVDDAGRAMVLRANGDLLLAGSRYGGDTDYDWVLARFDLVPNTAPVADAGSPQSVPEGSSVTLTGAASADSDGSVVSYEWDFDYDGVNFDVDAAGMMVEFSAAGLDGPMVRTVALRVTDNEGGVTIVTTTVTVTNVAPTSVSAGEDVTVDAGTAVTLGGSFSDPGAADTHTGLWHVVSSNGQVVADGSGMSFSFTPTSGGTYTVTFTVSDDDGGSSSDSMVVTSHDVAPPPVELTSSAGEDKTVNEGATVTMSGQYANASGEVTCLWHVVASNGQVIADGSGMSFSFVPADDGVYTVTLTVTDSAGHTASDEAVVTSVNVAPKARLAADKNVNEGSTLSLTARWSDPGSADTQSFLWHVVAANGQVIEDSTTADFSFVPVDNGLYTVTLTVIDDDGGSGSDTMLVTARNVAPVVRAGSDRRVKEGSLVTLTPRVSDAGSADTLSYHWRVTRADGSMAAEGSSDQVSFMAPDDGVYTVTFTATDDDGGVGSDQVMVTVVNVAPTAKAGAGMTVVEGSSVSMHGTFTDPGADTFTCAWSVSASNGQVVAGGYGANFSFTPMDDGKYVVTFKVTDDDGGVDSSSATVTVKNAAPKVAVAGDASGVRGQSRTFLGGFTDAGALDTHVASWDFGDGMVTPFASASSVGTMRVNHVYKAAGAYVVKLTVKDDDGAMTTAKYSVTIRAAELQADPMNSARLALVVGGTTGNDVIEFRPATGKNSAGVVNLYINNKSEGAFSPTGHLIAFGQEGNDSIVVGQSVKFAAMFYGGAGNDTLVGGAADDYLDGGPGADLLKGRGGKDQYVTDFEDEVM